MWPMWVTSLSLLVAVIVLVLATAAAGEYLFYERAVIAIGSRQKETSASRITAGAERGADGNWAHRRLGPHALRCMWNAGLLRVVQRLGVDLGRYDFRRVHARCAQAPKCVASP